MLECEEWVKINSYFKFENMWLQVEGFMERLKEWWENYDATGSPDEVLMQKVERLRRDIKRWNKGGSWKVR